jgi:amino-acid N-acetyltransferase
MSILRAKPSLRDSKNYLASFGSANSRKQKGPAEETSGISDPWKSIDTSLPLEKIRPETPVADISPLAASPVLNSILEPVTRRTALVKVQGPFTDRQIASIAQGMVYLEKLGLVSVIVVEDETLPGSAPSEQRALAINNTMTLAAALEKQGARARPIVDPIVRLGPHPGEETWDAVVEAHVYPAELIRIRAALRAGEIPVLPPFALDSAFRSVRIDSNHVIAALARGMTAVGRHVIYDPRTRPIINPSSEASSSSSSREMLDDVDLTPLRLMIINREGGIPSYARSGLPHLLINLESEFDYIHDTFHPKWWSTNPTALSNLKLARACLKYMPATASAIMVSHRSRSSLIANLITNKPVISSSLPHALLQGMGGRLTPDTPTLLRRGLPIRVVKHTRDLDRAKLTNLLEKSFGRKLNESSFYSRLQKHLDFVIVAGDYVGAAIVTQEPDSSNSSLTYLDKFAVLPQHQGDGTVDFLWVALHDETYGLGLQYSVNPNGGKEGQGEGSDLIWRSRANNPINKWYFERSSGHVRMGDWVMFWCDAERRLKDTLRERAEQTGRSRASLKYLEKEEVGRVERWAKAIETIPSSWSA